jgi:thiol:disulfide interchange protein DsbD
MAVTVRGVFMDSLLKYAKAALLILLLTLLVGGAAGCIIGGGGGESKVNWVYSLDEALSAARSDNKPVMIDFYADWCSPCRQMDSDTYSDDELGAFVNERFVPLKVNVDKSNVDGPYGISSIPQVVFLSPDGTEIDKGLRIVGYVPPNSFQSRLQAVLDAWSS